MSLNVAKSDVVAYGSREGVGCIVFGASVPATGQYTCLGMPMTPDLDLNAIVQDMKEAPTQLYHEMRPFLTHIHIYRP